jgi:hypothetical protein
MDGVEGFSMITKQETPFFILLDAGNMAIEILCFRLQDSNVVYG